MSNYLKGNKAIKALEAAGYPLKDSVRKDLMLKDGDPNAGRASQRLNRKTGEATWVVSYPWLFSDVFSI